MANLFDLKSGKLLALIGKLAEAGFTAEMAEAIIKNPSLAHLPVEALLKALDQTEMNPFRLSIEEQIKRFKEASNRQDWGFGEETFIRLAATAPVWPDGRLAVRSLRIRFGGCGLGVTQTFEDHAKQIEAVFGSGSYWRWPDLRSGMKGLRLLNGNGTHQLVVEWVIVDLNPHRKRDSTTAVRGPKSLADELLVVAWMFPEMIRAIDYDKVLGLYAAGYEATVTGSDPWAHVPVVRFDRGARQVEIRAFLQSNAGAVYPVPVLRE